MIMCWLSLFYGYGLLKSNRNKSVSECSHPSAA